MKTPLLYGFLAALGGALTSLAMYFTGMHDTVEKLATAQWIQICVGLVIVVTCLALAMREKRSLARAEEWGFGSAFLTGFLTGLAAAVIGAIFSFVYFSYINGNMSELLYQMQVAKAEAKGVPADRLAQAEPIMRKMMSPVIISCFQMLLGTAIATGLSLIVAIFFRARVQPVAPAEPPVTA